MPDREEIRSRKGRCNRSVGVGVVLMAVALVASAWSIAPPLLTTAGAIVGFCYLAYGVHIGWTIFYDREPDGPAS
jgi:threonine/homoserine/homoserine lactone efflux protein